MKNQKHFVVIDPAYNAELLNRLEAFFAPKTTSIALNEPVAFQNGFATFEPCGIPSSSSDVPFGGTLRIPSNAILMAGSSYDPELGFRCAE